MLIQYQETIFYIVMIILHICLFGSIAMDMSDEIDTWDKKY